MRTAVKLSHNSTSTETNQAESDTNCMTSLYTPVLGVFAYVTRFLGHGANNKRPIIIKWAVQMDRVTEGW